MLVTCVLLLLLLRLFVIVRWSEIIAFVLLRFANDVDSQSVMAVPAGGCVSQITADDQALLCQQRSSPLRGI